MFYKKRDGITVQAVEDETLLLDLASSNIHQLNATATLIWDQCDGSKSQQDLVAVLTDHYDIDTDTARSDLEKILAQLLDTGLVEELG